MSTAKLKFEHLEYIVMEGGGARGAAYLGAIRALEAKMQERMLAPGSNIRLDCLQGKETPALLDYVWDTGDRAGLPVIKGIAGSSAGAITTFALALGFNSVEIDEILKSPFQAFLKDVDAGVYRMVNADGRLAQAVHKKNKITKNKELVFGKEFKFYFDLDYTPINDVPAKRTLRNFIFGASFKIIVDGTVANLKQLLNLFNFLGNNNNEEDVSSSWRGLFKWVTRANDRMLQKAVLSGTLQKLLLSEIAPRAAKIPIQFSADSLMAMLSDAGMFSGFRVREFFMDMVIRAATKDTRFHRGFVQLVEDKSVEDLMVDFGIEIFSGPRDTTNTAGISQMLKNHGSTFKILQRSAAGFKNEPKLDLTLSILSHLRFKHFNKITNINFGACVSNFTTGNPVYFGHEWTPDFRIMEAVAASMSIPPAIRPLYNLSDVVEPEGTARLPFIDLTGNFDVAKYHLYELVVKKALQKEIFEDEKTAGTIVDTNNSIDVSTFLPKLRGIVNGEYRLDKTTQQVTGMDEPNLEIRTKVSILKEEYTVDYNMYRYFYNAVYKGLFLDGGYRNNIPYNFFRLRNKNIDSVLAIKLDEHFPPTLMKPVYDKIKTMLGNIIPDDLISDMERSERNITGVEKAKMEMIINSNKPASYTVTKKKIIEQTRLIFYDYLAARALDAQTETDRNKQRELNRKLKSNEKHIERLAKSTLKTYQKERLSPPWVQPVSILNTAFDGYGYGSERGQVKQISDHNQILPLYDFGIGTYDFEMEKIMPMIDLAQSEAEKATEIFFRDQNP